MTIKRKNFLPLDPLAAADMEQVQDNGAIQVSTITELASLPNTVKVAYCLENSLVYYYYGSAWVPASNPTGSLAPFAGSAAPTGWLLCYGQELAIASYGALYAVVSTTYGSLTNGAGGAGTTHFRVPDLRGRTIAALDNMGGSDAARLDWANTLGTTGGAQTHPLSAAESGLPAHAHSVSLTTGNDNAEHTHTIPWYNSFWITTYNAGLAGGNYNISTDSGGGTRNSGGRSAVHQHTVSGNTGNNTAASAASAHNNMQPTILMNYIIKT